MTIIILILIILVLIESKHFLEYKYQIEVKPTDIDIDIDSSIININGHLNLVNSNDHVEIMIPELEVKAIILGQNDFSNLSTQIKFKHHHKDINSREDNYWQAFIIKSKSSVKITFSIKVMDTSNSNILSEIDSLWLETKWFDYSPSGRNLNKSGFAIPLNKRSSINKNISFKGQEQDGYKIYPIKTHILGSLDNPIETIKDYTKDIIRPGDIILIGETPLAVMQGNYIHPSTISPSSLAKLLCRSFHPTSSLATACGMQVLINEVGPTRVIFAWLMGASLKILNVKGMFYRLSGNQARLIDDITGTTPPYDQTIVLGPKKTNQFCHNACVALGVDVAVVDVNDLGRVKVLATSNKKLNPLLTKALKSNPAGNGDERTPILILRTN